MSQHTIRTLVGDRENQTIVFGGLSAGGLSVGGLSAFGLSACGPAQARNGHALCIGPSVEDWWVGGYDARGAAGAEGLFQLSLEPETNVGVNSLALLSDTMRNACVLCGQIVFDFNC